MKNFLHSNWITPIESILKKVYVYTHTHTKTYADSLIGWAFCHFLRNYLFILKYASAEMCINTNICVYPQILKIFWEYLWSLLSTQRESHFNK